MDSRAASNQRFSDSILRAGVFLACLVLLAWQQRNRFVNAHLWAEDGRVFLMGFWEQGWAAIFSPYAGYLHVVPRVIVSSATSLSVDFLPHTILLTTMTLYAMSASKLVTTSYQHLISSRVSRVAACLALCFLPGLWEIVGNVANVHSVLYFGAAILCLKDPKEGFGPGELLFLLAAGLSAGEMVVLIPVFILRAVFLLKGSQVNWREAAKTKEFATTAFACCLLIGLSTVTFAIWLGASDSPPARWTLLQFIEPTIRSVSNRIFLYPWLNDHSIVAINSSKLAFVIATLAGTALAVFSFRKLNTASAALALLTGLCLFGGIALIWIARPDAAGAGFTMPSVGGFNHRYAFPGTLLGVLLAAILISKISQPRLNFVLSATLLIAAWHGAAGRGPINDFGDQRNWATDALAIKQTLNECREPIQVSINPTGWSIEVNPRKFVNSTCSE
jgi:hypothetical protein